MNHFPGVKAAAAKKLPASAAAKIMSRVLAALPVLLAGAAGARKVAYDNATRAALEALLADPSWRATVATHRATYAVSAPFPHVVIDNFFPAAVVRYVEAEIEEAPDARGCPRASRGDRENRCYRSKGKEFNKVAIADELALGPHTVAVMRFMKSPGFLRMLERLTGFDEQGVELLPDSLNFGSGVHVTGQNGHLKVHADFNGTATALSFQRWLGDSASAQASVP